MHPARICNNTARFNKYGNLRLSTSGTHARMSPLPLSPPLPPLFPFLFLSFLFPFLFPFFSPRPSSEIRPYISTVDPGTVHFLRPTRWRPGLRLCYGRYGRFCFVSVTSDLALAHAMGTHPCMLGTLPCTLPLLLPLLPLLLPLLLLLGVFVNSVESQFTRTYSKDVGRSRSSKTGFLRRSPAGRCPGSQVGHQPFAAPGMRCQTS